jgi:hypothetical protein
MEMSKKQLCAAAVPPGAVAPGSASESTASARYKVLFELPNVASTEFGQGPPTTFQPKAEMRSTSHEGLYRRRVIPGLRQRSDKAVEKRRCWR